MISNLRSASSTAIPLCVRQTTVLAEVLIFAVTGICLFYDSTAITWGDKWKEKIIEGLHSSEFAIIVLSEQFFDREWTERELHELLEQQNENKQKLVLPLLYGIIIEQLTKKYPQLGEIQCISAMTYSREKIAILLAKELIKRYKAIGGKNCDYQA